MEYYAKSRIQGEEMKAVFIVGVKQSGKDVVGERFLKTGDYHLGKFSSLLKEATNKLAGYPDNFWETEAKNYPDDRGIHPRVFITTISEGLKKRFGRDIITRCTLPSIIEKAGDKNLLFTDCRFPEEELAPVVKLLGKDNITIIRVKRESIQRTGLRHNIKRFLAKKGMKFNDPYYAITEVFIDDIKEDNIIYNSSTLEHLVKIADVLVDSLK